MQFRIFFEIDTGMNKLFSFNKWSKNKIGIFNMTKYPGQIISALDLLGIPRIVLKSIDPDLEEDFEEHEKNMCGIIISGGLLEPGMPFPTVPKEALESKLPKLGICLGSEILGKYLGSNIIDCNPSAKGEYGEVIAQLHDDLIFKGIDTTQPETVRMEHYKMLDKLPSGAKLLASTNMTPIAGFHHEEKKIWGLQFHPEKDWEGDSVIRNFYRYCLDQI
jgi:GMP synthase-like glutamine amidotransferase